MRLECFSDAVRLLGDVLHTRAADEVRVCVCVCACPRSLTSSLLMGLHSIRSFNLKSNTLFTKCLLSKYSDFDRVQYSHHH